MARGTAKLTGTLKQLFGLDQPERMDGHYLYWNQVNAEVTLRVANEILQPLANEGTAASLIQQTLDKAFPGGDLLGVPATAPESNPFPGGFCMEGCFVDTPYGLPLRTFCVADAGILTLRMDSSSEAARSRRGRNMLGLQHIESDESQYGVQVFLTWVPALPGGRKKNLETLSEELLECSQIRALMKGIKPEERSGYLFRQLEGLAQQIAETRFVRTRMKEDLEKIFNQACVDALASDELSLVDPGAVLLAKQVLGVILSILAPVSALIKDACGRAPRVKESTWLVSTDLLSDTLANSVLANKAQRQQWRDRLGADVLKGIHGPDDLRNRPGLLVDTAILGAALGREILALAPSLYQRREGVLIHGDNLGAMRLLAPAVQDKVHVAYIDPPYNTGNASVYIYSDARERGVWASQMRERLKLSQQLLCEEGILWSSIDDNEAHTLRFLLDDAFGGAQFVSSIAWRKKVVRGRGAQHVLPQTEYIIGYAKNLKSLPPFFEPLTDEMIKAYRWEDEQGPYKRIPLAKTGTSQSPRPNLVYPIEAPDGTMIPCPTHQWRWSRETLANRFDEIEFVKKRDGDWSVFTKQRLFLEDGQRQRTPCSFYDRATTTDGTREIKELFGGVAADFPKPTSLLRDLFAWPGASSATADEVFYLDYFAGSGSTADALMRFNREDQGRRQAIMIEAGFHFDTVLLPRIQKRAYSDHWKGGVPGDPSERSTAFQVLRLESFDEVLDRLTRQNVQAQEEGLCVDQLETGLWRMGILPTHRASCEKIDIVIGSLPSGDTVGVLWSPVSRSKAAVRAALRLAASKGAIRCLVHRHLPLCDLKTLPTDAWDTGSQMLCEENDASSRILSVAG